MNQIHESVTAGQGLIVNAAREWELVLAGSCADARESDRSRIRSSLESKTDARGLDWEAVLQLADYHGTSSLLYQNLSGFFADALPAAVMVTLRERHEKNVHKSLFLACELIRILDCLDSLSIDVITYKGLVLSESYYGDMAMRQSGDMDLFVRARDVAGIKNAVRDLGYTARISIPNKAEEDYIASGYECTFDSPAGKNLLEIQWALQPRFYAVDYDMEELFERSVSMTVAGRRIKTPSAEDLLLVLSVHAAKHVWARLIWLCDIAQILKREDLDWDWVRSRARELGIERIVHVTLILASGSLKVGMPEAIQNAIISDRAANVIAREIGRAVAGGVSYHGQQVAYFRLMMRLRERRTDRMRFLWRLTFTPGPGEWQVLPLPKALFPLYGLVRMGRLIARLARG